LHSVAWAAYVKIDFIVTKALANLGALCQFAWAASAQLQCHRVLGGVEAQEAFFISVQDRATGHHFGVEMGVGADGSPELSAVTITPIHQWGGAKASINHRARINDLKFFQKNNFFLNYSSSRGSE
jgi:hypothetical protein